MSPIPDDSRYQHVSSENATNEEVAYEYPFPPTTLADEAEMEGYSYVDRGPEGLAEPPPRQVAGTAQGGGRTNGTATP